MPLCGTLKNINKLEKSRSQQPIVIFVSLALVPIHICVKYEGSTNNHKTVEVSTGKKKNDCHLKSIHQIELIFHVHVPGPCVYTMCKI